MSFGSRFKARREELGLKQSELGKMIGVTGSAIGNYENGVSSPKEEILYKVFSALKCDANYLYQDEMKELETEDFTVPEIKMIRKYRLLDPKWKEAVDNILNIGYQASTSVPQEDHPRKADQDKIIYIFPGYSMPMSAGTGQPAGDEYSENYRLVKEPPRRASFIAPVSGDSMEPTFHDGDLVFVRTQEKVETGQIGVFFMDGQQWIKECGIGELISHNPKYEPKPMMDDIRCQGLVLCVCDESYFE